ncbi:MAG: hypothetical protein AB7F31_07685 [Parachlamydiales bacterium]
MSDALAKQGVNWLQTVYKGLVQAIEEDKQAKLEVATWAAIGAANTPRANLIAIAKASEKTHPNELARINAVQLGRIGQRTLNHIQENKESAIGWTVAVLLAIRLHPLAFGLPFLIGVAGGLVGDEKVVALFKRPEDVVAKAVKEQNQNHNKSLDEFQAMAETVNDGVRLIRKAASSHPYAPAAIAGALFTASLLKGINPNLSLWPLTLPASMAVAAAFGHYLTNEL